eukprot:364689_1
MANVVDWSLDNRTLRKQLLKLSKTKLVKLCKSKGISFDGNKNDIISRLVKNKDKKVQSQQSAFVKRANKIEKKVKQYKLNDKIKELPEDIFYSKITEIKTTPFELEYYIDENGQKVAETKAACVFSVQHIRSKILELMRQHEPNKVENINQMMRRWKRKENQLLKKICTKYKEKYTEMKPITFTEIYAVFEKIAYGNTGRMLRKCKRRADGKMFALKKIDKTKLSKTDKKYYYQEYEILGKLSHPNIV